jgi:hypothetical protein
MAQTYFYPSSASVTIAAVSANNAPIPSESILIGGENPSGNLKPIQTDATGHLVVSTTGTGDVNIAKIAGAVPASTNPLPSQLSDGTSFYDARDIRDLDSATDSVTVGASALPTGAATSANQTSVLDRLSGSLVPAAYDEIDLTYVASGAGVGQIETAVYKLASATVATLTLSYDGSDRLSSVVKS